MHTLDKPQRIDKSFAITSVVEKALVQNDMAPMDAEQYIEVSGYASRMYMNGKYVVDADQENVNTFGFDLKRLQNGTLPLLFNHKQDKPVGKVMEATYDSEGLLIKAKLFKYPDDELTNFVYHSVKNGVISAFSVGMLVKAFDVVSQDGEDYLQLAESEVIEVSLVAVPSNPEALFRVTNLKSVDGEDKVVTLLEKSAMKEENPDACSGFECALKQKSIKESEQEAQKEIEVPNTQTEQTPTPDEKEAVLNVTPDAMQQLEEILSQDDTIPAPVEDTRPAEGETVTPDSQDSLETDTSNDKPSDTPKEDYTPTKEDIITSLGTINVADLSDDEMKRVYDALAPLVEQIEERVVSQIVEIARDELMTVTAPSA